MEQHQVDLEDLGQVRLMVHHQLVALEVQVELEEAVVPADPGDSVAQEQVDSEEAEDLAQ